VGVEEGVKHVRHTCNAQPLLGEERENEGRVRKRERKEEKKERKKNKKGCSSQRGINHCVA